MNPFLRALEEAIADHAERLPIEFSLTFSPAEWDHLWSAPVHKLGAKEKLARCSRVVFHTGAFRVLLSEADTGDPGETVH